MKKFELADGNEIRGMKIRLYPTQDQIEDLESLSEDQRYFWNWAVGQTETALEANAAYAVKTGLVGPRPEAPNYVGLTPEESAKAKAAYREACTSWRHRVYQATKSLECCKIRTLEDWAKHFGLKYDYQLAAKVIGWRGGAARKSPGAHMLQSLCKNYKQKSKRRKKFRRIVDPMPLQICSGAGFELGSFGERRGRPFYNCQVMINGLKIRGRLQLGRTPDGRVLQGVAIRKEADGWWASIKQEVPRRELPPAIPGSHVGIDVGLTSLAAFSDPSFGEPITNPCDVVFAERIAGRQASKKPVGRLHLRMARHVKHTIHNQVLKPLRSVEVISVEALPGNIGQRGSVRKSCMKTVINMLKGKYGDRVREVDPSFTSQTCSQCGHVSKESWAYERGRYGKCEACGYREHRDINAARNIDRRGAESLAS